ncbi:uncharacterized protein EI90DRAFT_3046641 [Cantharellus anzutake]|uniref:uncharacterized protein n=1 Tax=Cantharellus anzutake TaxID=1750568 RepID=UPI001902CABA|nr:uncharacterized protein EI90DRAFT_3046641 [Cantharellus anzutake]KAF8336650.1 hypothetical protein EI90DRAFT_3046641 [Cantharellus anzutake]
MPDEENVVSAEAQGTQNWQVSGEPVASFDDKVVCEGTIVEFIAFYRSGWGTCNCPVSLTSHYLQLV